MNPGAGEGTANSSDADSGTRKLARENGDGFGMSTSYDFDFRLAWVRPTLPLTVRTIRLLVGVVMAIITMAIAMPAVKLPKPGP